MHIIGEVVIALRFLVVTVAKVDVLNSLVLQLFQILKLIFVVMYLKNMFLKFFVDIVPILEFVL